ncbi:MAG TPA: tautomerase family protein, partial [Candidatus Didemnitutus sp.]|nr:tautomerase family protein [Candidatus Didemnitutus sp.]
MPVISIEAPAGLSESKKQKLMRQVHAVVEAAYGLGTTLTFLREYSRQNVAIDGVQPAATSKRATTADS